MFKKAAQIVATFGLLVGSYLGYARGFATVSAYLTTARGPDDLTPFPEVEAKSQQVANELAAEVFGRDSWPAGKDRRLTYYDAGRGAYIYAQNYKFLNDRKSIQIWPFAMISASKDGKSRKSATSDEAIIDLNQPFGLVKVSAEPSKVIHARMTGNVHIVDDKGTKATTDDLHIRMAYVDYDEKTLQITSESRVDLVDHDMHVTGLGLTIQLRRKVDYSPSAPGGSGGGFVAETILLRSDAYVDIENASSTGVLPGSSKPDASNKTRVVATSDGPLLMILPKTRAPVVVGPPDPFREPDPTYARFERNVKVVRGTSTPDQLNCDTLDLTLRPDKKPILDDLAPADPNAAAPAQGGAMSDLKIRKAVAKGYAVWLQSESQGMKARCLELTYEKNGGDGVPDKTYLNGGLSGKLWVEKVDRIATGEKAGQIASVRTVQAMDATILDYGPASNGTSKVISRGPGKMDERPARGVTIERTVWWEDEMTMLTSRDQPSATAPTKDAPATIPGPGILKRRITLTGPSKLVDYKGGHTLDAQERIIAYFEAVPKPAPATGDGEARIKTLDAFKDVHLTTASRVLTARDDFHARFVDPEVAPAPAPVAVAGTSPAPTPAPPQATAPVAVASAEPLPEAKPEAAPAAIEPAIDGRANVVFATIMQGFAGGKSEVQDAKLRGSVLVHQDPAKEERRGKDLSGEALDINSRGNGLMNFIVYAEDPQAFDPKTKLAAETGKARLTASKARPAGPGKLARVDMDGRSVEAPRIGLDQSINYLWAEGAGHFYQLADRGLLDDKGLASQQPAIGGKPAPGTREPMVITWNTDMKGYGISRDFQGNTVAKFEFRGVSEEVRTPNGSREPRRGVQAMMPESAIYCDTMDVYMDKPIRFDRVNNKKPAADPKAPKEADPEIAILVCRGEDGATEAGKKYSGVDISSQKKFPENGLIKEKQRIWSNHVVYDKRTGKFEAPGPGMVLLYQGEKAKARPRNAMAVAIPTGATAKDGKVVSRQTSPGDSAPTLKLTQVKYTEGMRGNFGVARDKVETEPRESEFVGAVQAANAVVVGPFSNIDFDRPPTDNFFLSSDVLHVRSIPPKPGVRADAQQFLIAEGNAVGRTFDRTIQGDRITYDSEKELAYAYGENGKEVVLLEQKAVGQPYSTTRGKSGRFNKRTREFTILDPQAIQMVDLASGHRPMAFDPDLGGSPKPMDIIKQKRQPLRREGRQSTERNGFSGH